MRRLDAPTARELLVDHLMADGLRSAAFVDTLDLDALDIRVDDGARLVLPEGFVKRMRQQRPHLFHSPAARRADLS